jgi:hypothetical protein
MFSNSFQEISSCSTAIDFFQPAFYQINDLHESLKEHYSLNQNQCLHTGIDGGCEHKKLTASLINPKKQFPDFSLEKSGNKSMKFLENTKEITYRKRVKKCLESF